MTYLRLRNGLLGSLGTELFHGVVILLLIFSHEKLH